MTVVLALIAWPLMTSLSTAAYAQGTANISGVIYDAMGKPYAEAVLTLTDSKTKMMYTATADDNGHYSLMDLPGGMYSFVLKSKNQVVYQGGVMIIGGSSSPLDLNLKTLMATKGTPAEIAKKRKAEDDAFKAVNEAHGGDPTHQISLGEDFITKYPDSAYLSGVYTVLMNDYMAINQQDKMLAAGEKAIELNPDDITALDLMAVTLSRRPGATPAETAQRYQKAEDYGKHAIEIIPKLQKPAGVTDDAFAKMKSDGLSMAHSGLGLVYFQRQKYSDAAAELSQAVQLASNPDVVDYYMLGNASVQTSHFSDAIAAYDKCAVSGPLAARCKAGEDDAKKKASTQLSAPTN
jgi:tetratricopeptide (TPR) repeat protein